MTTFIALPRKTRSAVRSEFAGLESLSADSMSVEEKRSIAINDEAGADKSEALQTMGLKSVSYVEEEGAAVEDTNAFQHLGNVDAFVVNTESEGLSEEAQAQLENDYLIVPNIELGIPQTATGRQFGRRPSSEPRWPDHSGIATAHENDIRGQGVLVGVLDTGCDADHLELRRKRIEYRYVEIRVDQQRPGLNRMRTCSGFDVGNHGTHVCGIISGENIGVAPDVDLMVASVIESESTHTSLKRIITALDWMLSQLQVEENLTKPMIINMSLGFLPEWISGSQFSSVVNGMRQLIITLVDDFDVLPIIAIGNDGHGKVRAPAYFPEPLSVGAVDFNLASPRFSGGGLSPITGDPEPDISGFGVDVVSSLERNVDRRSLYGQKSGTSMATPYVTGIAALFASANPNLQGNQLRQHLIDHALPIDNEPTNRVGAGLARFIL